jgi:hypothetical protein
VNIRNLLAVNDEITQVTMELHKEEVEYLLTTAINLLINRGSQILIDEEEQDHQAHLFDDIEGSMQ